MTRGQERCLYVFPMAEFARLAEQLRQAPVTSKQARDYLRVFLSGASDEAVGQAGPDHDPADAAQLRRAGPGLRRDRRRPAGRDLGRRGLGDATSAEQEQAFAEQAEEVVPGLLCLR